jgi:hypothetical protein
MIHPRSSRFRYFKGGGGGSSTTTTGVAPEFSGLAKEYADRSSQLSHQAFVPYDAQRFAGQNGNQNAATNFYQQGMNGGSNPYLDQMVGKAQGNLVSNYNNTVRPQLDAMSARSGSFGNSGVAATGMQQQQALGQQLSDISTQMYGQQYNNDQANRMASANALYNAGTQQQAGAQNQLDFNYQQFQDAHNQDLKNLQTLGSPFQMNLGQISKTTSSGGGK